MAKSSGAGAVVAVAVVGAALYFLVTSGAIGKAEDRLNSTFNIDSQDAVSGFLNRIYSGFSTAFNWAQQSFGQVPGGSGAAIATGASSDAQGAYQESDVVADPLGYSFD